MTAEELGQLMRKPHAGPVIRLLVLQKLARAIGWEPALTALSKLDHDNQPEG